jgi:TonB-linked SusC/RagA family outer membrane protein
MLVAASGNAQERKSVKEVYIDLNLKNADLIQAFSAIESLTEFRFNFEERDLNKNVRINLTGVQKTVAEYLLEISRQAEVRFRQVNENISVNRIKPNKDADEPKLEIILDDITITGKVIDQSDGSGLPGVNVIVKGTNQGTVTDLDGRYSLDAPEDGTLVISSVGYVGQEIEVNGRSVIDISLATDITSLQEIVVIGYGTVERRDVTGAVGSLQSVDIVRNNPVQTAAALQGQVAGLNINKISNNPGEGYSIDIRGLGNFSGESEPLVVIDGVFGADMNVLNPNDIESIDVLKDASSTAIYGSRGANGVIIITTKRGKSGVPRITYSGYAGVKTMAHMPTFQNAQEFARHTFELWPQERQQTLPSSRQPTASELALVESGNSTDWVDLVTEDALQTSHNIGIAGGTGKTMFDFSIGYLNEEGNTIHTGFQRYTAKAGLESQVHDKVKVGITSLYTFSKADLGSLETLRSALRARPTGTVFTEDLQPTDAAGDKDWNGYALFMGINDNQVINPVVEAQPENYQRERRASTFLASAYIDYTPIKGLSFRTSLSTAITDAQEGEFRGTFTKDRRTTNPPRASLGTDKLANYTWDNTITYNLDLQNHNLTATGLASIYEQRNQTTNTAAQDLPYDSFWYHLGDGTVTDWSTNLIENSLISYMGRINYSFMNKYLLTLTGRSDGASQLSEGNKWQFFPSAAIAWRAGDETFIKNLGVFSDLKLRLSYGEVGNASNIPPYSTQSNISQTPYEFGGSPANGFHIDNLANKDLVWERSKEFNFGINVGFLDNRINAEIELYNRQTESLILGDKLPLSTGFEDVVANVGEIRNRGVEITLNTVNFATADFRWTTMVSFTKNNNEVTKLTGDLTEDIGNNRFVGYPVNALYYFEKDGIWQLDEADEAEGYGYLPGQAKFVDQNNDGKITDTDDRVIVGDESPSYLLGMRNQLDYKNFDFSFFLYTRQGVEWRSSYLTGTFGDTGNNRYNHDATLDYWTTDNPSTTYWGFNGAGPGNSKNSFSVVSANFVRISDITLGYTLPRSALERIGFDNFRVYAQALNPFVFTKTKGFNPEYNGNVYTDAPSFATYLLGLNVSF